MMPTMREKRQKPQACPLCKQEQDVIVQGWVKIQKEDKQELVIDKNRGYSFCNCRDILYTDWSNMKQSVYNESYTERYKGASIDNVLMKYVEAYYPIIAEHATGNLFMDVGCINPVIANAFKRLGYKTTCLDIIPHDFEGHTCIAADFEGAELPKSDIIWASHIFEHLKDPIAAVKNCNKTLNDNGLLFVAMPDPYFIDFNSPYQWGHWHIEEHHIFWNMLSFCQLLRENGFEIIFAKRNYGDGFICVTDYHILAKKVKNV